MIFWNKIKKKIVLLKVAELNFMWSPVLVMTLVNQHEFMLKNIYNRVNLAWAHSLKAAGFHVKTEQHTDPDSRRRSADTKVALSDSKTRDRGRGKANQ
jgi:hypothetical protein